MEPLENLYYALGELVYALAKADGAIQPEEKTKLHQIVQAEIEAHHPGMDVSEIIFSILEKDNMSLESTYSYAIKEMKKNSYYLSDELKELFVRVLEKVALAFPPYEEPEKALIERFKKDLAEI